MTGCSDIPPMDKGSNLLKERKGFQTQLISNVSVSDGSAAEAPIAELNLIHYPADGGKLVAYISPDPADGKKHPAIIWAHGGFGGIGSWLWEEAPTSNDQSVRPFLDAGIVTMCPSWRGENDNPGSFELFYGEVNDLLDALAYLKSLPYIDPDRIYLAGHSTGGTIALLSAVSTDQFRAIFSIGGAPNIRNVVGDGEGYGNTPFNYRNKEESYFRSAIHFTQAISTPTFYFEGEDSFYVRDALKMNVKAKEMNVPFSAHIIKNGTHFNIIYPINTKIAKKIKEDQGPICTIKFSQSEIRPIRN